jgi:hypothetical protein
MMAVRTFSTSSRPALRAAACGGRPRAGKDLTGTATWPHPRCDLMPSHQCPLLSLRGGWVSTADCWLSAKGPEAAAREGRLLRCTAQCDGKTMDMNYVLVFRFLAVTRWDVSSRVRDACANRSRASVRSRLPSVVAELVTTRGNGPTVEDGSRSAGTSEMSASKRSSRIPSRRPSTDALMITADTPCLPPWLVAEPLELLAVLVQPGRRALRRRQ